MKTGICKLCLKNKDLVNSHIFSEFLYKPLYDDNHKFKSISDQPNHKIVKDFQQGFKEYLLCQKCDNEVINSYEDYALKFLRKINLLFENNVEAKVIKNYDYTKFKLFVLSLIWRCHITSEQKFTKINLGSHAEKIRKMLLYGNSGKCSEYCFSINKFIGAESVNTFIVPPNKRKFYKYNFYYFMAYGYEWTIFISNSLKDLIKKYPEFGVTNEFRVFSHNTTHADFIQDIQQKMGEELVNKIRQFEAANRKE